MLLLVLPAFALTPVENAVGVHVSAAGLERLGDAVAALMPTSFTVASLGGSLACDDTQPDVTLDYALDELEIGIHIADVAITPSDGRLDITIYGSLDSESAYLTVTGDCSPLADLAEACAVDLPTTALTLQLGMALTLNGTAVDATVDDVSVALSPIGNPLSDCVLASAIGTVLGQDPELISNLITDTLAGSLGDVTSTLEPTIEDALGSLALSTSFALGSAEIGLAITPQSLTLSDDGLFIGLGATLTEPTASDCVAPAAEPTVTSGWPALTGVAPDGALSYDAALVVNKSLVDQLLYAVYLSGSLCVDVTETAGLPLDTSLFGSFIGDAWTDLFPVAQPLDLFVQPEQPISARFSDDGAPFRIVLDGLMLRGFSTIEARTTKVLDVEIGGEVGLDVPYSGDTLSPSLIVDPTWLAFGENDYDLLPVGYADGLASLVPTLLGSFLPEDLLPTVAIPSYQGIGLGSIWWMPDDTGTWMGGYALLDTSDVVAIELPACEGGSLGCGGDTGGGGFDYDFEAALGCAEGDTGTSGCDSGSGCGDTGSGCEGGTTCAATQTSRSGARLPFLFIGLAAVLLRRR